MASRAANDTKSKPRRILRTLGPPVFVHPERIRLAAIALQSVVRSAGEVASAKKSPRMPELDALRGLMLVWMTLTHLPTRVSFYSNQTFGFVSAAEGFIFLSAFLTGRIFARKLRQNGFGEVARRLFARALRLYAYHLALLAVAFTVVATVAVHTNQPSLIGLVDFFLAHPKRGIITSVLLIYRPPLLDILPMYILFLAGTPFVLRIAAQRGWKWMLIPSSLLWVAAQFGFRAAFYNATFRLLHLDVPFSALGAFDLFAWQFLWVAGLAVGSGELGDLSKLLEKTWVIAAGIAVLFLVVRHTAAWDLLNAPPWVPLFDKWHLGPVRLVNFASFTILFAAFTPVLSRWLLWPPLVTLGKASLEVFCAHLLICFEALALVGDGTGLPLGPQFAIIASSLLALYLVGRGFASSQPG
jgi:hypothetical protein